MNSAPAENWFIREVSEKFLEPQSLGFRLHLLGLVAFSGEVAALVSVAGTVPKSSLTVISGALFYPVTASPGLEAPPAASSLGARLCS